MSKGKNTTLKKEVEVKPKPTQKEIEEEVAKSGYTLSTYEEGDVFTFVYVGGVACYVWVKTNVEIADGQGSD